MQNQSLKNWKGTAVVMGVDWGDSGKGRMIDDLSKNAHVVARYNGGANTGHTVENQFGKFALHIMPSGIFNKNAICLVGRNVAVDLESLVAEMSALDKAKVSYKKLVLDEQAHLVMPWHKLRDGIREKTRTNKIGTTGKGIGPVYADRAERVGLMVKDLLAPDFKSKVKLEAAIQNKFYNLKLNANQIAKKYLEYKKKVYKYIGKTIPVLRKALRENKNILFEGAQGYFLDIDAGTYPFVTSSNPGVVGIYKSYDLHPSKISTVVGITKAYTTRVGEGPMPTKMEGSVAKRIIKIGREVGTTTGRVRSPGWLDLVLIKEAAEVNGLTALAITKLDVLSGISKIKICTNYKIDGKNVNYIGHDGDLLSKVRPQYKTLAGWQDDISEVREFSNLPKNAQAYIKTIEEYSNLPVRFISVGPKRGQVIWR